MQDTLERCREQLDRIDDQMIHLLEERMEVVQEVTRYKQERQMPVLQSGRERQVLERAVGCLKDPTYAGEAVALMNLMMKLSRDRQHLSLHGQTTLSAGRLEGPVGFPGVAGSFSEQAAVEFFGETRKRISYLEFEDVCEALRRKEIDYGVLPIENSSTGGIPQVYDLLGRYGVYLVGECRVAVTQNLAGIPGTGISEIRAVYSHPQGLEQSAQFLRHRGWEQIPLQNTAVAAQYVAACKDPSKAAICSRRAAEQYGLSILAEGVQDAKENVTRFVVIGRELEPEGADKVSLSFTLDHESGTLYRTLQHFAANRINLTKIESRPVPGALWHYRFYLDFEGGLENTDVRKVLETLTGQVRDFRVLGAYHSAKA